jgi:hypothetical protein
VLPPSDEEALRKLHAWFMLDEVLLLNVAVEADQGHLQLLRAVNLPSIQYALGTGM